MLNVECWILNIEFEYWIWMLNLNIEYQVWILNLSIEFEYWILNIEIDYWTWKLNVTGDESDLKDSGYILRLQKSGVFVSVDVIEVMGWGRVVLVVANYCAHRMVGKYLPPVTMGLTSAIFECGIYAAFGWIHWQSQS